MVPPSRRCATAGWAPAPGAAILTHGWAGRAFCSALSAGRAAAAPVRRASVGLNVVFAHHPAPGLDLAVKEPAEFIGAGQHQTRLLGFRHLPDDALFPEGR